MKTFLCSFTISLIVFTLLVLTVIVISWAVSLLAGIIGWAPVAYIMMMTSFIFVLLSIGDKIINKYK